MAGSSPLTAEQQEWYRQRFGVRYLAVQENPARPPRRMRRKHGRIVGADADLLELYQRREQRR